MDLLKVENCTLGLCLAQLRRELNPLMQQLAFLLARGLVRVLPCIFCGGE
eukprot:CAMPEP_0175872408 /NCGR_PEP_ID=MMETSP0107_2-20121207/37703_1 /TAXON_ID=195067 ORGANISM="Goniomonas pacifica, Strain CCMP1869" /NCGR_SAMPLE_ID=MMETSP0107_2 /ASSEMBLY_ACC=CAM_ASM_000203 /LENGTH=49 /DNA_ID= /DNA_START= /DNA_END= /DNA_ORIENTATION=